MEAPDDALARLDPAARLNPADAAGGKPRLRLGVGAAVVLLIVALITAVVVSAVGQQAGRHVIAPGAAPDAATIGPGATGAGQGASGKGAAGPGAVGQGTTGTGAGSADATDAAGAIIFVHVLGAVRRAGLFELREGARVMDAVAAAGGLTEMADPAGVNLARPVTDGEQLYLPALGEAQPGAPPGLPAGGAGGGGAAGGGAVAGAKVNLNVAAAAELESLPRIGPAMAQRIIDYREANGRFTSVEELRNVTGIGEKTFDGLKDLVTV